MVGVVRAAVEASPTVLRMNLWHKSAMERNPRRLQWDRPPPATTTAMARTHRHTEGGACLFFETLRQH